jgi:hypothetical protein
LYNISFSNRAKIAPAPPGHIKFWPEGAPLDTGQEDRLPQQRPFFRRNGPLFPARMHFFQKAADLQAGNRAACKNQSQTVSDCAPGAAIAVKESRP